jgi:hypothetical protein
MRKRLETGRKWPLLPLKIRLGEPALPGVASRNSQIRRKLPNGR